MINDGYFFTFCAFFPLFISNTSIVSINFGVNLDAQNAGNDISAIQISRHLRDLTLKITMLIALLSGQRCQTIHALDINDMQVVCHPNQQYVFQINKLLKTSRPGKHFSLLTLQAYPADEQLCIFKTIQVYLAKTKPLRVNC